MKAPSRLVAYAAGLVLVLAAGAGVGAAVGPLGADDDVEASHSMGAADATDRAPADQSTATSEGQSGSAVHDDGAGAVHDAANDHTGAPGRATQTSTPTAGANPTTGATTDAASMPAAGPGATAADAAERPAGLSSSEDGYTLAPLDTTFAAAAPEAFRFQILGPDGHAVTDFDTRHERDLHLVVVSTDLGDYQHLHPTLAPDGTWGVELALPRAGGYRAYADFAAAGAEPVTLAAELSASGPFDPRPLPSPATVATVEDYDVRLHGAVAAGTDAEVRFRVDRHGAAVTDLEPYLGAYGHLVAIRSTDRAYLHVHPTEASSPSEVVFSVHAPSPGAYRLFLDFQHGGVVRTAAFTIDVAAGAGIVAQAPGAAHDGEADHGSH